MPRGEKYSKTDLLDPSQADYCVPQGCIARSRFGEAMTTQRQRTGNRLARQEKRLIVDKVPGRRFPIQREIHKLESELNAFNERIVELESEGHRGHAMEVLNANAMDFARQIDELRCVLIESTPKEAPRGKPNLSKS
jgi:hypothetical protein